MTGKRIQVLLVEDNPGDARLIRENLADAGATDFNVVNVQTLASALERCSGPGIDAVIIDLGLPDSVGLDTLKAFRSSVTELPVVVLTGLNDEKIAIQAIQAGAQDYLIKGKTDAAIIARALRYAIERKRAEVELQESENRYRVVFTGTPDGIIVHDAEGHILDANEAVAQRLEIQREALIGRQIAGFVTPDNAAKISNNARITLAGQAQVFETTYVSASGKTIPAEVHERRIPWGDGQAVLSVSRDITERKRADIRERLAIDILTWLNQPGNTMDTIRDIIQLMQKSTGLEAVGIRLRESDDFPYYEAKGFTDDFLATERNLCERDAVGNIARDAQGNAVLECMCGNVLRGRTDPKFPFFTEAGSFWTNCTTDCMASTMKNESLRRIRNRCNRAGYESVALIPVKSGDEIIGLLQLNDHRRNQFTREIILFFEGLGASIGIAVARKKAREALNESEARFRELFNRMSSGVAVYEAVDNGADFVFRDFNPAAEKIEKISRKDILGRRVSEAFPGVKAFGVFEVFQRVWQTGKPEHFPLNIYKDERDPGSWRENWVFKLPAGEIVAIYNDITERKRTEQAVLDSEVRYHALFENSADGILIADVETKNFLYANLALCQMIGYAEEELKTMSLADIHPKDALPRVVADFESQMRGEKTLAAAIPCLRKDGAIFYADINSTTVALDGRTCLVGFFRDITERKRVEVELRKSEERFRQALENIPDVIVIYDRDLRIKNINAATLRITGRPVSDFIGRREEEIWPPEIYEVYLPTLRKAYETRTICSLETKLSLPGYNPRALCITCVPLLDENGEVREIMGVTHDLTESKQAENKLSEQLDELRRWQTVTSGREDRILKMKKEVNELLERLGEQPRYGSMEEK